MFHVCVGKWVIILLLNGVFVTPIRDVYRVEEDSECDSDVTLAEEGIIGQTTLFPWLGILKARLHGIDTFTEFITTIVMVKDGFALVIADDVARMPQYVFRGFVSVMFLTQPEQFWHSKLLDFMTHPEYNEETLANAIAIVQLELLQEAFPVKPICLPYDLNADSLSNHLYAVMYDDENMKLVKAIHKMQYKNKESCKVFYKNRGFVQASLEPRQLQCASAVFLPESCVWDAGTALVSNATGPWVLLGLGTKSLGCAHPTRFIDIVPYIPWIDSVTSTESDTDEVKYRRTAYNKGFGKEKPDKPVKVEPVPNNYLVPKLFSVERSEPKTKEPPFIIKRISQNEIQYVPTGSDLDFCDNQTNKIFFQDQDEIKAPNRGGILDYKVSIYDENHLDHTCTRIILNATYPDTAAIYVSKITHQNEGVYVDDFPEDGEQMVVPPPENIPDFSFKRMKQADLRKMEQHYTYYKDNIITFPGERHNIFLRLEFEYDAVLEVKVMMPHFDPTSTTTPATRTPARRRNDVIVPPTNLPEPMAYVVGTLTTEDFKSVRDIGASSAGIKRYSCWMVVVSLCIIVR